MANTHLLVDHLLFSRLLLSLTCYRGSLAILDSLAMKFQNFRVSFAIKSLTCYSKSHLLFFWLICYLQGDFSSFRFLSALVPHLEACYYCDFCMFRAHMECILTAPPLKYRFFFCLFDEFCQEEMSHNGFFLWRNLVFEKLHFFEIFFFINFLVIFPVCSENELVT